MQAKSDKSALPQDDLTPQYISLDSVPRGQDFWHRRLPVTAPCGRGGTGRHTGLKILRGRPRAGSTPAVRTNKDDAFQASASTSALLLAAQASQYDRILPLARESQRRSGEAPVNSEPPGLLRLSPG